MIDIAYYTVPARADLARFGVLGQAPKLKKKITHYNTLTWLQNAGNPIFMERMTPDPLQGKTVGGP